MTTEHPKVALVTGGNRGIGHEVVRQLAGLGFAVFLAARDRHKGKEAADALCTEGLEVIFLEMDVCDPVSIKNAVGTFSQKADHLDVLINNAAVLEGEDVPITKLNVESLERTLQTNVNGPILVTQDFLPYLQKASNGGRVINVSSGAGSLSQMQNYAPAYSISKAALNAVTRQFAACLRNDNVSVNSVDPGWVQTDMGGPNAPDTVAQGADTIVWLASDPLANVSGRFWHNKQEVEW